MGENEPVPSGSYFGRIRADGTRELWWEPAGGAPFDYLPSVRRRSPDGPSWGYQGDGPTDAAETILLHATSDAAAALARADSFCSEVLVHLPLGQNLELPATAVFEWMSTRGISRGAGWGPQGPRPVVEVAITDAGSERYSVALDGWDLLRVDLEPRSATASVSVSDLRSTHEFRWTKSITVARPRDGHVPGAAGTRIGVDPLPFSGWAVQIDGVDIATIERDAGSATHARVAIYDRGFESGFVFDEAVRYRQIPAEPVGVGERLRRFTGTPERSRIIGR